MNSKPTQSPNPARGALHALIVGMIILAVECVGFNFPFWSTLAASTDSAAARNTMGTGLHLTGDGLLKVADPTQAYLDVPADGTSSYVRIDTVPLPRIGDSTGRTVLSTIHVRVDGDGRPGRSQSVCPSVPRSLYVASNAHSTVRLWIEEPKNSVVPIFAVRANVRVPFDFSVIRVSLMALSAVAVALIRPRSRLWRMPLNTASVRQRLLFTACLLPVLALTVIDVVIQIHQASSTVFHMPGSYTYDFNQYGHVADSLLSGRTWLDLRVPQAFAHASDPYDPAVRERLLSRGVTPIYWDYAFFHGRWYSYFGVLPALVLFAPYRIVTSLWIPGGAMLPAGAAVVVLMLGFVLFGSLLVIRLLTRLAPHVSLAGTLLSLALFFIGSSAIYLYFRTNFYSVPFAASLLLSTLGLWLWLGARQAPPQRACGGANADGSPSWAEGMAGELSLPHLAGGSVCIAANFGCRPAFTLVALLGFTIFARQIRELLRAARNAATGGGKSAGITPMRFLRAPLAVLIPACAVVAPLTAYNAVRFGSAFDFGNEYQITVANMARYREPWGNLVRTLGYYMALPLHATSRFPFLMISPAPLGQWGYTEAMVGGTFLLCPVLLLCFAVVASRRRLSRSGCWGTLVACLALAMALMVLDSSMGGLGWRYMVDFGWLLALAAMPPLLIVTGQIPKEGDPVPEPGTDRVTLPVWFARSAVMLLLLASAIINVCALFVPGRDDALINTDPVLFHTVQSWFSLL